MLEKSFATFSKLCHILLFLLNFHEDLHGKLDFILSYLVSILTTKYEDYLSLLE